MIADEDLVNCNPKISTHPKCGRSYVYTFVAAARTCSYSNLFIVMFIILVVEVMVERNIMKMMMMIIRLLL